MHITAWVLDEQIVCEECFEILDAQRKRRGDIILQPRASQSQSQTQSQTTDHATVDEPIGGTHTDANTKLLSTKPKHTHHALVSQRYERPLSYIKKRFATAAQFATPAVDQTRDPLTLSLTVLNEPVLKDAALKDAASKKEVSEDAALEKTCLEQAMLEEPVTTEPAAQLQVKHPTELESQVKVQVETKFETQPDEQASPQIEVQPDTPTPAPAPAPIIITHHALPALQFGNRIKLQPIKAVSPSVESACAQDATELNQSAELEPCEAIEDDSQITPAMQTQQVDQVETVPGETAQAEAGQIETEEASVFEEPQDEKHALESTHDFEVEPDLQPETSFEIDNTTHAGWLFEMIYNEPQASDIVASRSDMPDADAGPPADHMLPLFEQIEQDEQVSTVQQKDRLAPVDQVHHIDHNPPSPDDSADHVALIDQSKNTESTTQAAPAQETQLTQPKEQQDQPQPPAPLPLPAPIKQPTLKEIATPALVEHYLDELAARPIHSYVYHAMQRAATEAQAPEVEKRQRWMDHAQLLCNDWLENKEAG